MRRFGENRHKKPDVLSSRRRRGRWRGRPVGRRCASASPGRRGRARAGHRRSAASGHAVTTACICTLSANSRASRTFRFPQRFPKYLSRDDVVSYLREYARHFSLQVVTGTTVSRIRVGSQVRLGSDAELQGSDPNWTTPGAFTVETTSGDWQSDVVVIATGQFRQPVVPAWAGREGYAGQFVHSSDYRNAAPFAGRRVLVVGAGNSGAEIATDLVDGGATFVAMSVRTVPPIVPRDLFGWPVQRTSQIFSRLPVAIANRIGRMTARLTLGDLTRYGLTTIEFAPYTTGRVPLIDVGFVDAVKLGRIALRPALESLTPAGVVFVGGQSEPFDAIIAATGFTDRAGVADGCAGRAGRPRRAGRALRRADERVRACTSSASRTHCAGTCSRPVKRRCAWRRMSKRTWRPIGVRRGSDRGQTGVRPGSDHFQRRRTPNKAKFGPVWLKLDLQGGLTLV